MKVVLCKSSLTRGKYFSLFMKWQICVVRYFKSGNHANNFIIFLHAKNIKLKEKKKKKTFKKTRKKNEIRCEKDHIKIVAL